MSSNSPVPVSRTPVPVPRTAVPIGIADPVEQARAELKAALAAIEQKANVPARVVRGHRPDSGEGAHLHTQKPDGGDLGRGGRCRRWSDSSCGRLCGSTPAESDPPRPPERRGTSLPGSMLDLSGSAMVRMLPTARTASPEV